MAEVENAVVENGGMDVVMDQVDLVKTSPKRFSDATSFPVAEDSPMATAIPEVECEGIPAEAHDDGRKGLKSVGKEENCKACQGAHKKHTCDRARPPSTGNSPNKVQQSLSHPPRVPYDHFHPPCSPSIPLENTR